MKKFIVISAILLLGLELYSQTKCPRGEIDCQGHCGRFIDENNDSYCDLSEQSEAGKRKVKAYLDSIAKAENVTRTDTVIFTKKDKRKDVEGLGNISKKDNKEERSSLCEHQTLKDGAFNPDSVLLLNEATDTITIETENQKETLTRDTSFKPYFLFLISGTILFFYLLTWYLSKRKFITKQLHRQIWNVLLLFTFLVSGLLGLFLVVQINYNFAIPFYRDILYWHVQFGIGMAIICIIHIIWHLNYYAKAFFLK